MNLFTKNRNRLIDMGKKKTSLPKQKGQGRDKLELGENTYTWKGKGRNCINIMITSIIIYHYWKHVRTHKKNLAMVLDTVLRVPT